jgi:hypothetical protein
MKVEARFRVLAAASAASVLAALAVAVVPAAARNGDLTFKSTRGVAALLAHYVVTPENRGGQGAGGGNGSSTSTVVQSESSGAAAVKPGAPHGVKISRSVSSDASGNNGRSGAGVSQHTGGGGNSTPPASASFIGQQGSAKTCSYFARGCNPPDMALAASPDFVLQGVNTQWQVWDTAGNVQAGWPVGAQAFFGVPNVTKADGTPCDKAAKSQPFLSDPRALYDPTTGRFWAAMLQIENGFGVALDCPFKSVYYVAVSQTGDPRGGWNVYEFEMSLGKTFGGQRVGADYTMIGVDGQAFYFSANMFTQDGNYYAWAEIFEANKAKMEAGSGSFTADGFYNLQIVGPKATFVADGVQPAINLDASAKGVEKFAGTLDGPDPMNGNLCGQTGLNDPCSGLGVWSMANPTAHDSGGPAPSLTGTYVSTGPYLINPAADQPSCNQCVDANDLRISGTPVVREGVLYAAWGTAIDQGSNTVPGIQWAEVSLSGSGGAQGYYSQPHTALTYPLLMPDPEGNVLMLFERMSHTIFPEVDYITKGGGENFAGTGVVLKAGESSYRPELCGTAIPVCRWGDYEAASFDGRGRVWVAGEYANQYQGIVPPVWGRNWGTWIGAIG